MIKLGSQLWTQRRFTFPLILFVAIAAALLAGKDHNWDQLNYHYYAGFSALHERLDQDFFPASIQSYLVPYGYVPFYLLVTSGISDYVIVALLAAFGGLAFCAAWEIGGRIGAQYTSPQAAGISPHVAMASAALAIASPIVLVQLGSSFIDLATAVFILWGVAGFLALQPSRPNLAVAVLAALCALAAGLKLTNAIFAVAAAVFVALAPGRTIDRAARLALFAFVGVIVSAAVAGPWMYGVWQQFDSPTFPLFNGLFGSPHFPAWSFEHYRFIPTNFTDALLTPLNLILPGRFLWTEAISPEGRFAVAFLLVVAFLVAAAFRRVTHDWRLTSLVAFFLVSWALWLATTGNGRYLMPIVILVGPIIACLVFALSRNSRWRAYSILFVLLVQAGIWSQAADTRWGGVPWSERWFSIEVPEEIKSRPIVVVSTSVQSSSFIAPMLHPRSAFVNAAGQYIIAPGKPGWERFKEIAAASGDVYALHEINELNADGLPLRPNAAMARQSVGRLGYRVLADQCKDIKLHGPRAVARSFGSTPEGGISVNAQEKPFRYYSLCKLEKDDGEIQIFLGGVNDVEPVFRALEERCPKLLQAGATNTSGGPGLWFRYYMGSDVVVQARRDRVEIARVGDSEETDIGSISDVAAGTFEFDCKPGWRMTWADKGIPTPL